MSLFKVQGASRIVIKIQGDFRYFIQKNISPSIFTSFFLTLLSKDASVFPYALVHSSVTFIKDGVVPYQRKKD